MRGIEDEFSFLRDLYFQNSYRHQLCPAALELEALAADRNIHHRSVFPLVPPEFILGVMTIGRIEGCVEYLGNVLYWSYIQDGQSQEFVPRVTVLSNRHFVDGEDGKGILVEYPHWIVAI